MPALVVFGRILFAVLFIYLGAGKLFAIQTTASSIAAKLTIPAQLIPYTSKLESLSGMPMPQLLAVSVGAFEILAGLMIAFNFGARFFSLLLILVVAASTYYYYDFWAQASPENENAVVEALKNLSIIGALFIIAGYGRVRRVPEPAYSDI